MKPDPRFVDAVRRRFAAPGEAPEPSACPPSDRIWDASHGDLPPEEVRKVVDHLHACPACAGEWRASAPGEAGESETEPITRRKARVRWMALAASLVLASALALLWRPGGSPDEPVFRDGREAAIVSLLPDDAALPREEFLLRWEPVQDGTLYSVRLDRKDLTPVHEARDLTASELLVPERSLADVPPGETLVWRVEAVLPDGRQVRSGALLVRLR